MSKTYDAYVLVNKEPFELTIEYEYGDGKTDDKNGLAEKIETAKKEALARFDIPLKPHELAAVKSIALQSECAKITMNGLISFVVDLICEDQGDNLARENIEVIIAKNYYPKSKVLLSTRNVDYYIFFKNRFFENNKFPEIEELKKEMKEISIEDPVKRFDESLFYLEEIAHVKQKIFSKTLKQHKFSYEK